MQSDHNETGATPFETNDQESATPAQDAAPKWHLIYYALAAFDFLTICLSLFLGHQIMDIYTQSVDVNKDWSIRSSRYSDLGQLAMRVNAPGNDVFDSQNVAGESATLDSELDTFTAAMADARRDLSVIGELQASHLSAGLANIDASMEAMVSEAQRIFAYFDQGRADLAGQRMATMDRKYASVTIAIASLQEDVSKVQQLLFAEQVANARALKRWEYLIAGFIVLMVAIVVMYGHYLARKIKSVHVEKEKALAAITAAEIRHRAVIDVMRDAQMVTDRDGTILSFNPAAENIFGYTADEVLGQNLTILMPEAFHSTHAGYIDRYLTTRQPTILGKRREGGLCARHKDGTEFPIMLMVDIFEVNGEEFFSGIVRDITEEKVTRDRLDLLVTAVEHTDEAIAVTDPDGAFQYVNPAFEIMTGYGPEDAIGQTPATLLKSGEHSGDFYQEMWDTISNGQVWSGQMRNRKKDGTIYDELQTISPIHDPDSGDVTGYVAVKRDITEQLQLERQLIQSQKLESIGQLAAGIAHEINTPTQYVGDNTRFVKDAFDDIGVLFDTLAELQATTSGSVSTDVLGAAMRKADVEYLRDEVPRALEQSLEGVERVAKIVRAMKEFSHPAQDKTLVDLNAAIQSTVTVASNEWKYVAELETDFDPALPLVNCLPGEFNQVILNIIVNAAHAIAELLGAAPAEKGRITVSTRKCNDWAEICIADTGAGMPEDVKARIFDPFFTTKEVGRGTGQGLNIAHNVVVDKHGGTIDVDTRPGQGTRFTIRLPLEDPSAAEVTVAA